VDLVLEVQIVVDAGHHGVHRRDRVTGGGIEPPLGPVAVVVEGHGQLVERDLGQSQLPRHDVQTRAADRLRDIPVVRTVTRASQHHPHVPEASGSSTALEPVAGLGDRSLASSTTSSTMASS
jgi:hypothetical protein